MNVNLSRPTLFFAFLFLANFSAQSLSAQPEPQCFQMLTPKISASAGDTVCVPVLTKGFDRIVSMQFVVKWDTAHFDYVSLGPLSQSALPGIMPTDFAANTNQGRVSFAWHDFITLMGVTLPDSSQLFEVCLRVKKTEPGFYPVTVGSSPTLQFEAVKLTLPDWKSFMMPYASQVGGVLVGGATGTLTMAMTCVSDAGCSQPNGFINASVSGGVPPYQFSWTGPNGFTSTEQNPSNLVPGEYQLTVTDQVGDVLTNIVRVVNVPNSIQTSVSKTDPVCPEVNGCVKLTVNGNFPPFSYQWSTGQPFDGEHCGLGTGTYTVTITDAKGCTAFRTATLAIQGLPSVQLTTRPVSCNLQNGCITLTVSGSDAPFTYEWSTGQPFGSEHCGLAAGAYAVTVTNAKGCTVERTAQIGVLPNLNIQLTPTHIEKCGELGKITSTVTPSQSYYTYLWSNGATTKNISGLNSGYYWLTVTVGEGCKIANHTYVENKVKENWDLKLVPSCNPDIEDQGSVALTFNNSAQGLTFPVTVAWNDGTTRHFPTKPANTNILDELTDVPSGAYSAVVTHPLGCTNSASESLVCADYAAIGTQTNVPTFMVHDDLPGAPHVADSCFGVFVDNFNDITSFSFTMAVGVDVAEIRGFGIPGLSLENFSIFNNGNSLGVAWQSGYPISLPDQHRIFEVCVLPKSSHPYIVPNFWSFPVYISVKDQSGHELPSITRSGYVRLKQDLPVATPHICSIKVFSPDCSTDNMYKVWSTFCDPDNRPWWNFMEYYDGGLNGSSVKAPFREILFANPNSRMYSITGYGANANQVPYEQTLLNFPGPLPPAQECVWPGDSDNNGSVNHHDLLYLGTAFGASGPARSEASTEWLGQDCDTWEQHSPGRHVNFKNMDTDGNGNVDAADTTAIVRNWGKVINPTSHNPFAMPHEPLPGAIAPKLFVEDDTIVAGLTNQIPLLLGTADQPVENVGGIAFSVHYDPAVVTGDIRFAPHDSWFAQNANCLYVQKDFRAQGRLDVAIVRTDGNMATGWGSIGNLFLNVDENLLDDQQALNSPAGIKTLLRFKGLNAVDREANSRSVEGHGGELTLLGRSATALSAKQALWENAVTVFPNPASDLICAESKAAALQQAAIYDMMGKLRSRISASGHNVCAPTENLPAGTYLLQVLTEHGSTVRKFTVAK